MIHLEIDPHRGVPVYRQIVEQVKYYVAAGVLQKGTKLPSIRQLAHRLAVNPATVVKAYDRLQQEGIIEMQHGRGAFVCDAAPAMSQAKKKQELRRLARRLVVEAHQMGASADLVIDAVRKELEELADDK